MKFYILFITRIGVGGRRCQYGRVFNAAPGRKRPYASCDHTAARRPAGWWLGRVGVGELDRYDCYSGVSRLFGAANYVKLRTRSGCWRKIGRWRILSLSNDRLKLSSDRATIGTPWESTAPSSPSIRSGSQLYIIRNTKKLGNT